MKKLTAIILALSILLLCACSGNTVPPAVTAPTTSSTASQKVFITEWNSDLLPDNFPAPPLNTYNFEIAQGNHETDVSDYSNDWVRIRFTCPKHNLHSFTNAFLTNGYKGGTRSVAEGLDYFRNGLHGYWQDGTNIVKVVASSESLDGEITVTIDIIPCSKGLPEALLEFFPDFDGVSSGNGIYCGHDASLEFISGEFQNSFAPNWHWEFLCTGGTSNCFIGVTQEDFESYCNLLGAAKFSGPITSATVDGFSVTMVDVIKDIDGTTYGAYMLYNPSLMTLDFVFTNNPKLITED